MADTNDGSLIFDTELDESGFEKGTDKLQTAIKDLTDAVSVMGDNMMSSFNKVIPLLQSVANSTATISGHLTGTASQTEAANEQVVDSEQRVSDSVKHASEEITRQTEATTAYVGAAQTTQGTVSALEKEINSLNFGLQSVSNSAETGFANGNAVLSFDSKVRALEQRLEEARAKLTEFGNTNLPTAAYTTLSAQISKAEQALFRLYDRRDTMQDMGVKENSKQWERLSLQIENAEALVAQYERERNNLAANGGAFVKGSDTEEYARMKASLDSANETLTRNKSLIDQEALAQARLNVLTAQEAVAAATTTRAREAALERLKAAQAELNNVAASMSNKADGGTSAPTEEKISMWSRLGATMRNAGSAALRVSATLAKIPFQAASKGAQKLTSVVKNYISQTKKAHKETNFLVKSLTSLKRMLITRIKRMFISAIFNSVKESLKTLAQFSDAFNDAMSSIKNRSKELSGNLAVSFGNIVQTLEPIVTGLLEKFSTALTYINALFAMLAGKSTMTVAKKQTESYRDSLDDAAESAEDLKNQVYGFDQLNKRTGKNDSGSGSSDGSNLYEEVPIDSVISDNIKSIFEELKNLWDEGEYFDFGKKFAELLNMAVQSVDDWINGTFRPKGVEWANNIAETLNGLVAGVNWSLLGKTVADGINSIADIFHTFFTTFDFENLGTSIGTALNSLFANVDWDLIGQAFADKWNALVDFIHGLVTETDWSLVGDSLADLVQSFADTLKFDKVSETLSTALNGIVDLLQHFIDGVDFIQLGADLASGINDFVSDVDWVAAGKMLGDGAKSLLNFINTALEETDWQQVGHALKDLLAGVDWNGVVDGIVEGIGAAIGGLAALLWGLIEDAWNDVVDWWKDTAYEDGEFTMQGLLDGIVAKLTDIGNWIREHIFQPFIDGFKKAFGIASPSTVMEEQGGFVVEGFLNGITNAWSTITSFFSDAWEGIKETASEAWDSIKSKASTAWGNIKTAITDKATQTKDKISETGNKIKTTLSEAWTQTRTNASDLWDKIKTTVSDKFNNLKTSLDTTSNNIKTAIQKSWTSVNTEARSSWQDIKTTVSNLWNSLKTELSASDWTSVGTNLVNGLKNGITSAWNGVKSAVSWIGENVNNTIRNIFDEHSPSKVWEKIGEFLGLGLKNGIKDEERTVLSTVANMASNINDELGSKRATLEIGAETDSLLSRLGGIANQLAAIVTAFRGINDALSRMAVFNIPAIATGSEVPYKTRLSSDSPSNPTFDIPSDLDEMLSDHTYLLRQILELLRRLKLNISPDELAQALAYAMRGATRGYGGV